MATGDDALAEGMTLVPGSGLAKDLDTYDNQTRDYIAQFFRRIWSGVRDITTAAQARAALGLAAMSANADASTLAQRDNAGNLLMTTGFAVGGTGPATNHLATRGYVDTAVAGVGGVDSTARATANAAKAGYLDAAVYARTLGGSYRVAYVGSDGTLGWVSSSRRHKKNIKPAAVDPDAVLSMQLVTFLYKVEIDTGRLAELQHGLIAEQLDELGLDWLVDYGEDGQPEGVRYDRIALALLPVLQRQEQRITAIENHLDALGGDLHA